MCCNLQDQKSYINLVNLKFKIILLGMSRQLPGWLLCRFTKDLKPGQIVNINFGFKLDAFHVDDSFWWWAATASSFEWKHQEFSNPKAVLLPFLLTSNLKSSSVLGKNSQRKQYELWYVPVCHPVLPQDTLKMHRKAVVLTLSQEKPTV